MNNESYVRGFRPVACGPMGVRDGLSGGTPASEKYIYISNALLQRLTFLLTFSIMVCANFLLIDFTMTCSHVNQRVHLACNFNCLIESEALLKVTGSHAHCKCGCGNISYTVQDRNVVTT